MLRKAQVGLFLSIATVLSFTTLSSAYSFNNDARKLLMSLVQMCLEKSNSRIRSDEFGDCSAAAHSVVDRVKATKIRDQSVFEIPILIEAIHGCVSNSVNRSNSTKVDREMLMMSAKLCATTSIRITRVLLKRGHLRIDCLNDSSLSACKE